MSGIPDFVVKTLDFCEFSEFRKSGDFRGFLRGMGEAGDRAPVGQKLRNSFLQKSKCCSGPEQLRPSDHSDLTRFVLGLTVLTLVDLFSPL